MRADELAEICLNGFWLLEEGRVQVLHAFLAVRDSKIFPGIAGGSLFLRVVVCIIDFAGTGEDRDEGGGANKLKVFLSLRVEHSVAVPEELVVAAVIDLAFEPECRVNRTPR